MDSDSDQAQPHSESWPLPGPGPRAGGIDDGDHARQPGTSELGGQQQQQPEPGKGEGQGKRPWWRRRIAIWSFVIAAVLLVAFVILLTLGLLGYLKVGSFSTRNSTGKASSDSEQQAPNPLSTIPLLSEPTFTYVAPPPPPITVTPAAVTPAAATPSPTNLGTLNIVRYAMTCWRCPLWPLLIAPGVLCRELLRCNGRFVVNLLCSWSSRPDVFRRLDLLEAGGRGVACLMSALKYVIFYGASTVREFTMPCDRVASLCCCSSSVSTAPQITDTPLLAGPGSAGQPRLCDLCRDDPRWRHQPVPRDALRGTTRGQSEVEGT